MCMMSIVRKRRKNGFAWSTMCVCVSVGGVFCLFVCVMIERKRHPRYLNILWFCKCNGFVGWLVLVVGDKMVDWTR